MYGKIADTLHAAHHESGLPVPDHLRPPFVDDYLQRYLSAFWELSTCRNLGFAGAGPIPWDAIDRYADRLGYLGDAILYGDFMYLIRQLDAEFLGDQEERRKREQETGGTDGKTSGLRAPNSATGSGRFIER